ncbi:UNVERIFIED_ORG: hypothetical protein GGD58_000537 [Rhizobium pisi]
MVRRIFDSAWRQHSRRDRQGMAQSAFGFVVISPAFINRKWTQHAMVNHMFRARADPVVVKRSMLYGSLAAPAFKCQYHKLFSEQLGNMCIIRPFSRL